MSVTLSLFAGAGAQFLDDSGNVLTGGLIYTYAAGTTTPLATYTSNLGTTALPNPIVLNAAGRVPTGEIWLTTGFGYKFVTKDANGVLIGTYDNIPSSAQPPITNDASSIAYEQGAETTAGSFIIGDSYLITSLGTTNFQTIGAGANTVGTRFIATGVGTGTGTAQLSQTVQNVLRHTVYVTDFGATGDGVTDDYPAVQAAIDYLRLATNASNTNHVGIFNQAPYTLHFPAGKYLLSKPLIFDFTVNLEGETTSNYGSEATVLQFTAITAGLVFLWSESSKYPIYNYTTNKVTSISATAGTPGQMLNGAAATGNASWSSVKNLNIWGTGSGTSTTTFVGTASVTGSVLNVTAVTSGALTVGSQVIGNNCPPGCAIASFGTGTGGIGSYNLFNGQATDDPSTFYAFSGNLFSGIESRVSLNLDNVLIYGFHGNGITIYGQQSVATPNTFGGADGFNIQNVTCYLNDGQGFFVSGGDTNTGVAMMCQFVNNKGWGVFDSSHLGNTYIGGQASYNPLGSWGSFYDTGKTMFLNCYAEDGVKHIGRDAISIGGISNGGLEGYVNTAIPSAILGGQSGSIQSTPTIFRRYGQTPNETQVSIALASGEVFRITDNDFVGSNASTFLTFESDWPSAGFWGKILVMGMANQTYPIWWAPTPLSTGTGAKYGTSANIPGQLTASSIALPYRRIYQDTAAPTVGEAAVGDVVYNIAPVSGGYIGWVCTVAGTPGTWKTFGVIS